MCPTIQMNYLAVHKVSGLQIEQQFGYFSNFSKPLQWTQLLEKFVRFYGIHRCVYATRRDRIEPDTLGRKFNRQGPRDGLQACLG